MVPYWTGLDGHGICAGVLVGDIDDVMQWEIVLDISDETKTTRRNTGGLL